MANENDPMDEEESCDVCDICGDDHETRDCEESLCGQCFEILDNCDCEHCYEIDAAEWIKLGCPHPRCNANEAS